MNDDRKPNLNVAPGVYGHYTLMIPETSFDSIIITDEHYAFEECNFLHGILLDSCYDKDPTCSEVTTKEAKNQEKTIQRTGWK